MAGLVPAMTKASARTTSSPQRLQFARQGVGPLRDVAGAETDDEVAAAGEAVNHLGELGGILQRNHLAMAMRAQAEHEVVAVDALDWRFARRIDLGDDDGVGIVEAGAEFLEQRLQAGEAMRLHHGDDLAVDGLPRRLEYRCDLDGMVAIVVDHGDAVPLAGPGEAALHAAETCHRLADR